MGAGGVSDGLDTSQQSVSSPIERGPEEGRERRTHVAVRLSIGAMTARGHSGDRQVGSERFDHARCAPMSGGPVALSLFRPR